jgi:hypothetical protein
MKTNKELLKDQNWWNVKIAEWKASGKTKEAFCIEQGLSQSTLYRHCKRQTLNKKMDTNFVEINPRCATIPKLESIQHNIVISFPSGIRVELITPIDLPTVLAQVAKL